MTRVARCNTPRRASEVANAVQLNGPRRDADAKRRLSSFRGSRRNSPLRQRRKRGAQAQAIGVTKGGRNSKIHAVVDEFCRPWVFVLTPGNTADCAVAEACVSLIPGVSTLIADKGYAMRSAAISSSKGSPASFPANPIARPPSALTSSPTMGRAAFAAVRDVALSSSTESAENLAPNCPDIA